MKIAILDYATLGYDLDLSGASKFGEVIKYETTSKEEIKDRITDVDIIIVNKIKITKDVLQYANKLKLICETATGFDNIDIDACREKGIVVTNTPAYCSDCVAQLTVSMALSLYTHLFEYRSFVHNGSYSKSNTANKLTPVFHEIAGKIWGIIGYGNIGKKVAKIASSLGCDILLYKRTKVDDYPCVDLNTLLDKSDIISIHCPLNDNTRNLIDSSSISKMKKDVIIINVARGGIWDEEAIADAIIKSRIGGIGCDVFTKEPFDINHPFSKIYDYDNVILTPHMAWGSYESRKRCFDIILSNIESFLSGNTKNVVS